MNKTDIGTDFDTGKKLTFKEKWSVEYTVYIRKNLNGYKLHLVVEQFIGFHNFI